MTTQEQTALTRKLRLDTKREHRGEMAKLGDRLEAAHSHLIELQHICHDVSTNAINMGCDELRVWAFGVSDSRPVKAATQYLNHE